jgi:hypothetical protein
MPTTQERLRRDLKDVRAQILKARANVDGNSPRGAAACIALDSALGRLDAIAAMMGGWGPPDPDISPPTPVP